MTAVGQIHAEDGVARFEHREVDCHVRLRSGMGLDVDVIRAEELFAPFDGQGFGDVDVLASPVVAFRGIALRVLVGHDAALRLENGLAHKIFRGDQLEFARLPAGFIQDGPCDFRIDLAQ